MTYWAREHQDYLRRLHDIAAALEAQMDYLDGVRRDLADDDKDATRDSWFSLQDARRMVGYALTRIEEAKAALPTPVTPKGTT